MLKLENRLIAFLDVLGFSYMLSVNSLEDLYEKYSSFINRAKNETFFQNENDPMKRTNFEFARFISDSLILISHPTNDIYNTNNFLMAISRLLSLSFQEKFPLRGAVIFGNVILDDENGIVISKEIPLLLAEEKKQEWVGCIILENAQNIVFEAVGGPQYKNSITEKPNQSDLIHFYSVPTKIGKVDSFVLNYAYSLSDKQQERGLSYLENPKKENVKNYFNFFKTLPLDPNVYVPANIKLVKTRSGFSISIIND